MINVGVAWGCAAYLGRLFEERFFFRAPSPVYLVDAPCGFEFKYDRETKPFEFDDDHYYVSYQRDFRLYGLPCLSMQSMVSGHADRDGWVGGWDLPWKVKMQRGYPTSRLPRWFQASHAERLALVPVMPGFAINTIFYAVIAWAMFAGPGLIKRRRRIKRGLCVRCAYDLRGRAGDISGGSCPECGAAPSPS
jgi:hypothetical protein